MKQSKCEIKDIPISELKQSKYNPRKNIPTSHTAGQVHFSGSC